MSPSWVRLLPSVLSSAEIEQNPFFFPDPDKIAELETYMQALTKEGNSIGAQVTVVAKQVPVGLGEPVFDRLDADLAHALDGYQRSKRR